MTLFILLLVACERRKDEGDEENCSADAGKLLVVDLEVMFVFVQPLLTRGPGVIIIGSGGGDSICTNNDLAAVFLLNTVLGLR